MGNENTTGGQVEWRWHQQPAAQTGWICPNCRRGVAPWMAWCCNGADSYVTVAETGTPVDGG